MAHVDGEEPKSPIPPAYPPLPPTLEQTPGAKKVDGFVRTLLNKISSSLTWHPALVASSAPPPQKLLAACSMSVREDIIRPRAQQSTINLEQIVDLSPTQPPSLSSALLDGTTARVGSAESVGRTDDEGLDGRHGQEDCIVQGEINWKGQTLTFAGIADGHGQGTRGGYASQLIKDKFIEYLQTELSQKTALNRGAINSAFKVVVDKLDREIQEREGDGVSGSTFTGTLFTKSKSFSINIGDSQTLLCKKGQAPVIQGKPEDLSKSSLQDSLLPPIPKGLSPEKETRNPGDGSTSKFFRWQGPQGISYSVRFITYTDGTTFKKRTSYNEQGEEIDQLTINRSEAGPPHVTFNSMKTVSDIGIAAARKTFTYALHANGEIPGEERMVSVSDGITDVMTPADIDSLVWQMAELGYTEERMAATLVKAAFIRGSKDNLSATVSIVR